jgi:micrococcal nuclease
VKGVRISRVVDGDTIELNKSIEGSDTVRLIGIDAPEECQPLGKDAAHLSTWQDEPVKLEFDEERKDRYGRLLAYVYVHGEMLNKRMRQRVD